MHNPGRGHGISALGLSPQGAGGRFPASAEELKAQSRRFGLVFDPVAVFQDFARTLREELDFRREVGNARAFGRQLPEEWGMPRYFSNLSGKNIVVTEWVEGLPLDRVADPALRRARFDELARMSAAHILERGLYYEDPHQENVFVTPEGRPYLLDFGRLGRMNEGRRRELVRFLGAVATGQVEGILEALVRLTTPGDNPQSELLARRVRRICEPGRLGMELEIVDRLFQAAFASGYYVRVEFTQMLKAFLILQGVAREDPAIGHFRVADYILEPLMREAGRR